jgi:predicted short-subunit dehydrogenase-like oxidoreductase (DUF2520 family)
VPKRPRVAIVGAGSLATGLAQALRQSGYIIREIIGHKSPDAQARFLAAKVGTRAFSARTARLDAELLWLCVPDREIRAAATSLAKIKGTRLRTAFHSSGALLSRELAPLRNRGIAVASVHPLMTFVPGAQPSLAAVPFALEGDKAAIQIARRIVRDLGGESFVLPASRKPAYHSWATFTSPLLVAFLVAMEEAARAAGLTRDRSRRMSIPIIRQTLENYARIGPARSFSGPIIRGDVETVAKHLVVLRRHPEARQVYTSLARIALENLPANRRDVLRRFLKGR